MFEKFVDPRATEDPDYGYNERVSKKELLKIVEEDQRELALCEITLDSLKQDMHRLEVGEQPKEWSWNIDGYKEEIEKTEQRRIRFLERLAKAATNQAGLPSIETIKANLEKSSEQRKN